MANEVLLELIKTGGSIITLAITGYIAIKQIVLSKKHDELKKEINGRMSELLEMNKASSKAEGNLEGRADQKKEDNEAKG